MASFEEELLQLTEKKSSKPKKSSKRDSDDEGFYDTKRKSSSHDSKKPLKKRRTDESDDEDKASSSDEAFNDGYDSEFYGDEADRKWLNGLSEVQREEEFGNRYERRRALKEQWELKQQLKRSSMSSKDRERKEREQRDRGSKKKEKKGKALTELKKRRAKAYERDDEEEDEEEGDDRDSEEDRGAGDGDYTPAKKEDRSSSSSNRQRDTYKYSEEDKDDRSSDVDEDERQRPLSLEEMNDIRIQRETICKWLNKPFFDEFVPGYFIRIGIGADPKTHVSVYRVAQIVGVVEKGSSYTLPGDSTPTNKQLRLRIANKEKEFKMETISNKPFTETEYSKWLSEMRQAREPIMSSKEVVEKKEMLAKMENYKYTSDDIKKMLNKKREENQLPVKLAAERARLVALRDAARDTDTDEYLRLCEEVQRLEDLTRQRFERLDKGSRASTIANINLRNKQANFDKSMDTTAREEKSNNELDPFSRRKTFTRVLLSTKSMKAESAEQAEPAKPAEVKESKAKNNEQNGNGSAILKKSLDKFPTKALQDEHNHIDLDIPVDLISPSVNIQNISLSTIPKQLLTPAAPLPLPVPHIITSTAESTTTSTTPSASKMSLADYMRRRKQMDDQAEAE